MSKIYLITSKSDQSVIRYVRANTLNGAIRALTDELYEVEAADTDQLYRAMQDGGLKVLDAVESL